MLETDAHLKLCPVLTVTATPNPGRVATVDVQSPTMDQFPIMNRHYCEGNGCMAWQWTNQDRTEGVCIKLVIDG